MHRSLAVVAAVFASASSSWAQRPTDVQEAKAGIAATWAAFNTHWTANHARESVAAFFTDDAINMIPGTASDSGRGAIEKRFAAFLAANKVSELTQTTDEVQVAGQTAYERGTFSHKVTPNTGQPSVERGRYLAIWHRQPDGKWKCARFLYNDLPQS